MMAIQGGYLDVVNKLLDKKEIDVNDGDSGEQLDIVEMLLGKKKNMCPDFDLCHRSHDVIDFYIRNKQGLNAIMLAITLEYENPASLYASDIVKLLIGV